MSKSGLWLTAMAVLVSGCTKAPTGEAAADAKPAGGTAASKTANGAAADRVGEVPLIPREVLFGNPQRAAARISPDGNWLGFLAPVDGVMNVWVAPVDDIDNAEPVTEEEVRPITAYYWTYDSQHVLYRQDTDGDENWHIFATNIDSRQTRNLTPIDGVNARIHGVSERFPNEVLVALNDRIPQLHDIWRVHIETGELELVQENHGVAGFLTDDDFRVRLALDYTPTGGQVWLLPEDDGEDQTWTPFQEFGPEDAMTSGPAGFDKTGQTLYFEDSRDRNTAGLFAMDLETGDVRLLADDDRVDVGGVIAHPTEKHIQAVSFTYARTEWKILDDAIAEDIEYLKQLEEGEFLITSRTLDDSQWTVAYIHDDGPVTFYRYERTAEPTAHFLFTNRDDLKEYPLVTMHDRVIQSRDGLDLVCYLSLPPESDPDGDGVPDEPVPMVLTVHGGPWARDTWGYNATHQWLANRGYAVLSVNFRGSSGFGKDFINAANREWAGKMHDDLIDAVQWAVDEGIAHEDQVCIMGGSYGGYATLVGLTFTPDVFACGVDIVGPSSLVTLLENVPPYWAPFMPVMKVRVGDVDTEEGRAELLERSPLTRAHKIERPLLIAQGANDPRVTQLESDQIVEAMIENDIPVTYVLYPDEGHGFRRPENRKSFNAVTEAFLAEHLGGRFEPVGTDFEGATITVPAGADQVPGLLEALVALPREPKAPQDAEDADEESPLQQPPPDHILRSDGDGQ